MDDATRYTFGRAARHLGNENAEFVAAETGEHAMSFDRLAHSRSDLAKYGIADAVTV
jgi:hypothetical protein